MSESVFPNQGNCSVARAEILDSKFSVNLPQFLCSFRILVECNPNKRGQGKMLVLPSQLLCFVLSTLRQCFPSSQPILCRPHTQTRRVVFSADK